MQGVDLSPEQVQIARQVVPRVHEDDAIGFLERNPSSFDFVAGLDIIEHLHKSEVMRFLDAVFAALKPGGRVVLQTPNADSPLAGGVRYGDFTHETCFNPRALARLMCLAGFKDTEFREMGPLPWGHSPASTVRAGAWHAFRFVLKVWNLVECGAAGDCVFTRVFLISAMTR